MTVFSPTDGPGAAPPLPAGTDPTGRSGAGDPRRGAVSQTETESAGGPGPDREPRVIDVRRFRVSDAFSSRPRPVAGAGGPHGGGDTRSRSPPPAIAVAPGDEWRVRPRRSPVRPAAGPRRVGATATGFRPVSRRTRSGGDEMSLDSPERGGVTTRRTRRPVGPGSAGTDAATFTPGVTVRDPESGSYRSSPPDRTGAEGSFPRSARPGTGTARLRESYNHFRHPRRPVAHSARRSRAPASPVALRTGEGPGPWEASPRRAPDRPAVSAGRGRPRRDDPSSGSRGRDSSGSRYTAIFVMLGAAPLRSAAGRRPPVGTRESAVRGPLREELCPRARR
jgi:hypothetical protein